MHLQNYLKMEDLTISLPNDLFATLEETLQQNDYNRNMVNHGTGLGRPKESPH